MTNIQFIITVILQFAIAGAIVLLYKRRKKIDSLVELDCEFCLSDNTDCLLDTIHDESGVEVDGILGNDFMVAHDYIIDYESYVVKHKTMKISIKEIMDILELPLIILWQNNKRYTFLLDTGANASSIHSRCIKNGLDFEYINQDAKIWGFGGGGASATSIKTKLHYYSIKKSRWS